jgi:phospholipase/carboxylesterase
MHYRLWILAIVLGLGLAAQALAAPPAPQVEPADPTIATPDPLAFLAVDPNALLAQAQTAHLAGDIPTAIARYLDFLHTTPSNAAAIYNLAGCYGLQGDEVLAARALDYAFMAGFEEANLLETDTNFAKVRGKAVFDETVARIIETHNARQKAYGETVYSPAQSLIKCRVRVPEDYDPTKPATLIIGLHGLGQTAEYFSGLADRFAKRDFIFATPESPYPYKPGGYGWWPRTVDFEDPLRVNGASLSEQYIVAVLAELRSRYKIGDVYLLGFSQGCSMTYLTGIHHPELFKGLICFSGWLQQNRMTEAQYQAAQGLRVFISHGTADPIALPAEGAAAREGLKSHGFDVTFFEFEGGHALPVEATKAAEEWLRAK